MSLRNGKPFILPVARQVMPQPMRNEQNTQINYVKTPEHSLSARNKSTPSLRKFPMRMFPSSIVPKTITLSNGNSVERELKASPYSPITTTRNNVKLSSGTPSLSPKIPATTSTFPRPTQIRQVSVKPLSPIPTTINSTSQRISPSTVTIKPLSPVASPHFNNRTLSPVSSAQLPKKYSSKDQKYERCVRKVKERQTPGCAAQGYPAYGSDAEGNTCYNPWAVCHKSIGY